MYNDDILVNRENKLPFYYVPTDLITIPSVIEGNNQRLALHAYKEFLKLQGYSQDSDINLFVNSGYRSYIKQLKIYRDFLKEIGLEATRKRVALPGTSEHQTGLACDIAVIENGSSRNMTEDEMKWLLDNAFKYGFILRYPKGKEDITGYNYEPWHFRYVGTDIAEYIMSNDFTLEEYWNKKGKKKVYR